MQLLHHTDKENPPQPTLTHTSECPLRRLKKYIKREIKNENLGCCVWLKTFRSIFWERWVLEKELKPNLTIKTENSAAFYKKKGIFGKIESVKKKNSPTHLFEINKFWLKAKSSRNINSEDGVSFWKHTETQVSLRTNKEARWLQLQGETTWNHNLLKEVTSKCASRHSEVTNECFNLKAFLQRLQGL